MWTSDIPSRRARRAGIDGLQQGHASAPRNLHGLAVIGIPVAIAAVVVALLLSTRFASGSSVEVSAAKADALWAHVPAGSAETSRYTVRADSAWVPWRNDVTGVGRYYRSTPGMPEPPSAWRMAATSAGWRAVAASCGAGTFVFVKQPAGQTARLRLELDPTKTYLRVSITFGTPSGGDPTCGT
jgi:hypothetical protein